MNTQKTKTLELQGEGDGFRLSVENGNINGRGGKLFGRLPFLRLSLVFIFIFLLVALPLANAVNINPSSGSGGTVQIVNISSVSSGDNWIDVSGGSIISFNEPSDCTGTDKVVGLNADGTLKCASDSVGSGYWEGSGNTINPVGTTEVVNMSTQNVTINNLFSNFYDWILSLGSSYLTGSFNGKTLSLDLNETRLNNTIDAKTSGFITTESDPLWTSNSTLVAYKAENNTFTGEVNTFKGINLTVESIDCFSSGLTICKNATGTYFQ